MALDANIVLGGTLGQSTNGFETLLQGFQNLRDAPFKKQLTEQKLAQGEQDLAIGQQKLDLNQQKQMMIGVQTAVNAFDRNDHNGVVRAILDTVPPEEQQQELTEFNNDPAGYIAQAKDVLGAFNAQQKGVGSTAKQKERAELIRDVTPALDKNGRFDPKKADAKALSAAVDLGIFADAGTISKDERIALNEGLTEEVAKSKGKIKEAESSGKTIGEAKQSKAVAKARSDIARAVQLATAEAKAQGETLTDLKRARASLPGLRDVVGQLKELAPIATSTLGGALFDRAVKETGFGSTKGATAQAKFIAIVNNQVLPLLKPTFGAAFTFQEGESLKATMGDPKASPEEKMVQLNAFIDGKVREIEAKELELSDGQSQDTGITAEQFRAMTPEQRAAALQQLQGQ